MTVCIAAACDNGEQIVTATDGLLSMGDVTGEGVIAKMLWHGPWQFLYAGEPGNFAMINEEISQIIMDDSPAFSRRNIQETVRRAYRKVLSRLASFESLAPFDMTIEQFKENGREFFGEAFHDELLRRIHQKGSAYADQVLVVGWGKSPLSDMIYEVGPQGDWLHEAAGWSAIGSGSQMAQTMLLLLGQARHRTLAETIFNVACAKFSSEKSIGLDVGRMTAIHVSKKSSNEDNADEEQAGRFVSLADIEILRSLWEAHLKPRIPDEARIEITGIAARVNDGKIAPSDMVEHVKAAQKISEKYASASSEDSQDLQATTTESSDQRPLPESRGGSGES